MWTDIAVGFVFGAVVSSVSGLIGYVFGWNAGTKDTERRWAEAVGRADDARRSQGR